MSNSNPISNNKGLPNTVIKHQDEIDELSKQGSKILTSIGIKNRQKYIPINETTEYSGLARVHDNFYQVKLLLTYLPSQISGVINHHMQLSSDDKNCPFIPPISGSGIFNTATYHSNQNGFNIRHDFVLHNKISVMDKDGNLHIEANPSCCSCGPCQNNGSYCCGNPAACCLGSECNDCSGGNAGVCVGCCEANAPCCANC
jgi:hypothetical protein